jgi:small subunit ribosomal protein S3
MGQKIHPIGFRIGVIRDWESKWYADKNYAELLYEDHQIRRYLKRRLQNGALSHIEIERQANKIKVSLYTGKPGVIIGRGGKGVDDLKTQIESRFKKQVALNVQEIRNPELDGQLVSESIAQQIEKRIAPKRAIRQAIQRSMRMGAQGIRVLVAGRLGGAEMARREGGKDGKIPLHTLRADIDYGFTEARTTYGNIGVKVWLYRGDILPDQRRLMKEMPAPEPFAPRMPRGDGDRPRGGRDGGRGGGGRGGRGGGGGGYRGGGGGGGYRGGGGGGGGGRPGGGGVGRPGGGGGGPRGRA